jgi:hypothetical protein
VSVKPVSQPVTPMPRIVNHTNVFTPCGSWTMKKTTAAVGPTAMQSVLMDLLMGARPSAIVMRKPLAPSAKASFEPHSLNGAKKMRAVGTTSPFAGLAALGEVERTEEDAEVGDDAGDGS